MVGDTAEDGPPGGSATNPGNLTAAGKPATAPMRRGNPTVMQKILFAVKSVDQFMKQRSQGKVLVVVANASIKQYSHCLQERCKTQVSVSYCGDEQVANLQAGHWRSCLAWSNVLVLSFHAVGDALSNSDALQLAPFDLLLLDYQLPPDSTPLSALELLFHRWEEVPEDRRPQYVDVCSLELPREVPNSKPAWVTEEQKSTPEETVQPAEPAGESLNPDAWEVLQTLGKGAFLFFLSSLVPQASEEGLLIQNARLALRRAHLQGEDTTYLSPQVAALLERLKDLNLASGIRMAILIDKKVLVGPLVCIVNEHLNAVVAAEVNASPEEGPNGQASAPLPGTWPVVVAPVDVALDVSNGIATVHLGQDGVFHWQGKEVHPDTGSPSRSATSDGAPPIADDFSAGGNDNSAQLAGSPLQKKVERKGVEGTQLAQEMAQGMEGDAHTLQQLQKASEAVTSTGMETSLPPATLGLPPFQSLEDTIGSGHPTPRTPDSEPEEELATMACRSISIPVSDNLEPVSLPSPPPQPPLPRQPQAPLGEPDVDISEVLPASSLDPVEFNDLQALCKYYRELLVEQAKQIVLLQRDMQQHLAMISSLQEQLRRSLLPSTAEPAAPTAGVAASAKPPPRVAATGHQACIPLPPRVPTMDPAESIHSIHILEPSLIKAAPAAAVAQPVEEDVDSVGGTAPPKRHDRCPRPEVRTLQVVPECHPPMDYQGPAAVVLPSQALQQPSATPPPPPSAPDAANGVASTEGPPAPSAATILASSSTLLPAPASSRAAPLEPSGATSSAPGPQRSRPTIPHESMQQLQDFLRSGKLQPQRGNQSQDDVMSRTSHSGEPIDLQVVDPPVHTTADDFDEKPEDFATSLKALHLKYGPPETHTDSSEDEPAELGQGVPFASPMDVLQQLMHFQAPTLLSHPLVLQDDPCVVQQLHQLHHWSQLQQWQGMYSLPQILGQAWMPTPPDPPSMLYQYPAAAPLRTFVAAVGQHEDISEGSSSTLASPLLDSLLEQPGGQEEAMEDVVEIDVSPQRASRSRMWRTMGHHPGRASQPHDVDRDHSDERKGDSKPKNHGTHTSKRAKAYADKSRPRTTKFEEEADSAAWPPARKASPGNSTHIEEIDNYNPAAAPAPPEGRNKKLRSGLQDYLKFHGTKY